MGNCWSNQSAGNNQGRDQLFGGHNNARLSQSTSNSTSFGCSSHSARSSRLSGPSSSNICTTSNTNTSLLCSENSQTLQAREEDDFPNGQILDVANLKVFTLAELKAATKDFRADTLLGQGGFGGVYKGWLKGRVAASNRDGESVIAIKRLNSTSRQGIAEWLSEVNFLGRLSHPNVVRLLGFGSENSELCLVYEFMQRGSLDNHLFGRGSNVRPLSWDTRLKIMIGAARGLNFLHSLETKVIYRDFKPSNILLDKTYTAKLSDFGLAKFGPSAGQTHVSTQVMGTHGYTAPEYIATGHLYVKSDVYGFGIVLVEILTGKRIADIMKLCGQHQSLLDWLKSNLLSRMKMRNTMDARLQGKYPSKSASQVAQLALRCVQTDPKVRPSMIEVAETLEQIEAANYEKPLKNNRKRDSHSPADHVHGRPDRA